MTSQHSGSNRSSRSNQSDAFERLHHAMQRWVWNNGWQSFRDIQEQAIKALLDSDRDLIIAAPTASGKTEAALLPLITRSLQQPIPQQIPQPYSQPHPNLDKSPQSGFDLVYISPLRALINDQFQRAEELCQLAEMPITAWHGEASQSRKKKARQNPSGLLLITPESLEAMFTLTGTQIPWLFRNTRAVIIDELHAFLDTERGVHLRSLLNRVELAVDRRIQRVGLSATLNQMQLVKEYLRPQDPDSVDLIESSENSMELQAQLRGYQAEQGEPQPTLQLNDIDPTTNEPVEQFVGKSQPKPAGNSPQDGEEHPEYPEQEAYQDDEEEEEDEPTAGQQATASAKLEVAKHLYDKMRGSCNLVFAGSRQDVEWYADALRKLSERDRAPLEFFPHHSNLSQSHRRQLERNLKAGEPTTAVCTSTLELGIDIGDINTVAQIGPPYSVASLRHRLGRSGRRPGQPAILRMYNVEEETNAESHPIDRLHLRTLRSMANLELLVEGWCEPPSPQAMHLSTLVHQIMSVIAERSSSNAKELHQILCREGPFQSVGPQTFISLLRHLGQEDNSIIQQEPDNQLILGPLGERIVNHYTFYAVFQTPEEYRVVNNGQTIGSMPNNGHLVPKQRIILAGKPWRIIEVQHRERIIEVRSTRSGKTTHFGNSNGIIHDRIIARTKQILNQEDFPNYLDQGACQLLQKARTEFRSLKLHQRSICPYDQENILIAPWTGTVKTNTLTSLLQAMGHQAHAEDGLIQVEKKDDLDPIESLKEIAEMKPEQVKDLLFRVAEAASAPYTEKYHPYLSPELRFLDTLSSKLSPADAPKIAQALLNGAEAPTTDLE